MKSKAFRLGKWKKNEKDEEKASKNKKRGNVWIKRQEETHVPIKLDFN
jgi:hypothetical protein